jgi:two-component system, NtrC family, nitrogen regulation response regulator GlnG
VSSGQTELIVTDPKSGAVQFRAYRIQVVDGPDAGKEVRLDRGSLVVGSAPDADLRLNDGAVSRAHVKLVPYPDGVDVTDLDSKNGTFTSGVKIMQARLAPGSEIMVGRTTIRLSPEDREAEIEPSDATRFAIMCGRSRPMRQMFALLELVAPRDTPILIEGEAGVGKQRVANAIHGMSGRAQGRLHVIEGSQAPDDDFLPEVPTNVGSVLIRDVDALGPNAQRVLCRMLETRQMDVRMLASTRKDLEREATAGRFDRALLLRLGVVRVRVPPLRERASDIPVLIEDILEELGRPHFELGPADLGRLQAYAWPDNVRELRSVIERAVSLDSLRLGSTAGSGGESRAASEVVGADLPYKQARAQMIEAFEREYVRGLLAAHDGNISKAARAAGIDRVYLHRLIRKYNL